MNRAQVVNWYTTLTPRDQRVLHSGGVVTLLIVLVAVFVPLQRSLVKVRAQLQTQQADLQWMQQFAPTLAAAGPGPAAPAVPESLAVLIDRSARESGLALALTGSQPAGNGSMRVQMENADFNLFTGWISRLSLQHGLLVQAATVTSGNDPGVVNASLQLHAR